VRFGRIRGGPVEEGTYLGNISMQLLTTWETLPDRQNVIENWIAQNRAEKGILE
jgi:hypothetical protein